LREPDPLARCSCGRAGAAGGAALAGELRRAEKIAIRLIRREPQSSDCRGERIRAAWPTDDNQPPAFVLGVEMPKAGEEVKWTGFIRTDSPQYVKEQLSEFAHRRKRSLAALIMRMMAEYRDGGDRRVFYVRDEDMVDDRRKVKRARGR